MIFYPCTRHNRSIFDSHPCSLVDVCDRFAIERRDALVYQKALQLAAVEQPFLVLTEKPSEVRAREARQHFVEICLRSKP
jgi:hypothetical protein